ncbi:MAG: Ca2+:H+ antiporter [Gaiellales bacterium]|nr:Ca2+:H+ antiporter [Gaiellales bacterium]
MLDDGRSWFGGRVPARVTADLFAAPLRASLLALLALGPLVVALDWLGAAGKLTIFLLAAAALVPLAWLIGEATDNAAYYTGPGIGGFLNATVGNAPELISALVAVSDGLTDVVRASLVGSIAGNLLLVLGFTMLFGQRGTIDRRSAAMSLGLVAVVTLLVCVPSVPGLHGDPDRRALAELSLPVAVVLLIVRIAVNRAALRRQRVLQQAALPTGEAGWPFRAALAVLAVATVITAFVTNALVGSLETFARRAHLSEFFVAVVIVAIVGNATEHGSAVLLARRGRIRLATEISLASSAQVAGLLIPLVVLVSWVIDPLALSFRPVELGALAISTALSGLVLYRGTTTRLGGAILLLGYAGLVVAFAYSGNR